MKKTITILSILAAVLPLSFSAYAQQYVISKYDKDRAADLVSKMTLEEKVSLIAGCGDGFHTAPVERLGIPSVRMADGPQGVRNKTNSTYYPCGLSLAASFNREAAGGVGTGIGYDACARGVRIMLCPGVNIYRSALCGRNFEYYGEDPYLASETAVNYIKGIQSQRVIATIKHFAVNNQEYDRHGTNSAVGERVLNEIYFPTFRKAVEQAKVGAVMTSYNPVNGTHAAENPWLIRENLRAWGFDGIVMSDWSSTYTTIGVMTSGLDLEMPWNYVSTLENIRTLLDNGGLEMSFIDEKCTHILQTFSAFGLLDKPMKDEGIPEDYDLSRANAYAAAKEGPVMLKNDGILPLAPYRKSNIIVLGPNADIVPYGGGSGRMDPIEGRNVTLYAGLGALGKGYNVSLMDWKAIDEEALAKATAVIFAAGFNYNTEKEGSDRKYVLPDKQDDAICRVARLNPRTVVVVYSGGEVDINPWKDEVAAIIFGWYSGQEGGRALADIISGKISPSGRLPFTFWGSRDANPASKYYAATDPEVNKRSKKRDKITFTDYNEGLFLGYRGVGKTGGKPMYPFGYGLTYTTFDYSDMNVVPSEGGFEVSFTISNTGKVTAKEAAQVYVAPLSPSVVRPAHELKGFAKVELAKGESRQVKVFLPRDAFSYYSVASHSWKVDPGKYKIQVGASSENILLETEVTVGKN